jgi:crotonobetainyl-CoA:carnitine CoA-transferase CaiB-like acyl-CoA transferase
MSAVLKGVRVIDFGRYIAGPYCGALLAEYGADVIRIEKRDGSEDRFPAQVGGGVGALFLQMNRNKRSVTLDPASPEGREVVARLVRSADVVIANLPAATLKSMGLDYETLCTYRKDIIFVTNTAFGPVGPMSANVGWISLTGPRHPMWTLALRCTAPLARWRR